MTGYTKITIKTKAPMPRQEWTDDNNESCCLDNIDKTETRTVLELLTSKSSSLT